MYSIIDTTCPQPASLGYNIIVMHPRDVFRLGHGTALTCNDTNRFEMIPPITYVVCAENGRWIPSLPKSNCQIPNFGDGVVKYSTSVNGKEHLLMPGSYIGHNQTVKYQCKEREYCSETQTVQNECQQEKTIRCDNGMLSERTPRCYKALQNCQIPFNIPYFTDQNPPSTEENSVTLPPRQKAGILLKEGEYFDYICVTGYAPVTNVSCLNGQLTDWPRCEPRTCQHPGVIENGKIYVINFASSRYDMTPNISLRHGVSIQYECNQGNAIKKDMIEV
ncbi:unnamed protein product [Didymodactylos carnosus]|uniref:Sushi domain-containing protein n=1 Tax=Didymodactylos carnosus TaxID=1234261 RepID=A0A8S2F0W4_9BILA|nr:unnamed protein product [Didymodactylos carnosus]CAF4159476.1 unnamed protein product [Didymodactylos carnosus]